MILMTLILVEALAATPELPTTMEAIPNLEGAATVAGAASPRTSTPDLRQAFAMSERLSTMKAAPVMRGAKEVKVFKEVAPSVLFLHLLDNDYKSMGIGSGTVVDYKGRILTNWHVVEGAEYANAYFKPPLGEAPSTSYAVKILHRDKKKDLALLEFHDLPSKLKPARLAETDAVEIGQDVHAIGHPKGEFWTFTTGTVSNYIKHSNPSSQHDATVIMTAATLNGGNSGGPLLNDSGTVIGVNSYVHRDAEGMNYAVSAEEVRAFIEQASSIKAKPQPEILSRQEGMVSYDSNSDGTADAWHIDDDGDGHHEWLYMDTDYDGKPDKKYLDSDGNNTPEIIGFDRDKNGKIDSYTFDRDQDGTPEARAFDDNEDGEIDRVERI